MSHRLYDDLATGWPMVSPAEAYEEEGAVFAALMAQAADGPIRTVLELGSGGGTLAMHLPAVWDLTLVDRSEAMLAVSRTRNPTRMHFEGDMRTLRLGQTFDAVLLHDAVMYLTSRQDLAATLQTIAAHLRAGGAALVVPDVTRETFVETTLMDGGDGLDGRSARLMEWRWDPDPSDDTFLDELVLAVRDGDRVRTVHETHEMGLYSREVYADLLADAGLDLVVPDVPPGIALGEVFLTRKVR